MELVSKQVALSGRLKPEARLGLAISEFAQALDSERRNEFRSMQNTQDAKISGRDIIKMTEEINQEGARRHRSWRPHGTKVGGFLARIQTFATIGDVLVGGSQNLIATGVWSAVRLSLTIATSYLNYFEKLSTLFMRLGTSWALHEDFARLFPASEVLQAYFCEYLVVLMRLCNKVVLFCQKNTGAQLLSSIGSSFDSEFGSVQKELDQWGCLIQQQTQFLATKMATHAQKGRQKDLKQRLLRQLSPEQNDFETRWRRQRKKGTCEWIFDSPSFRDWRSTRKSATLCVYGRLGSGKTVTMANIVARMNLDRPCAYVFCASQEPASLKATNILGSIAYNLIDNLPAEATCRSKLVQNEITKALDPETIIDLLLDLLPEDGQYTVIADGLEDCSDSDIDDVLPGLRRLMQNRTVLFCYSSRSDSRFQNVAKQHLAREFSVCHDDSNHDAEVEAYITQEVTRRNATRHLSSDLEELVRKQLIAGAQGMYLWVSLQLDTIFPTNSNVVITDDQILNLIKHLPRDLPEAFEQALERIPDRRYEGRIMKLVMSAVSPLDLDEIRVALCVIVGEQVWHPEKIAKDGLQLISLCGGNLLDLDEEDGKVRFIHHSVIQHLLSPAVKQSTTPYHFTIEDAENFTGATCVTYLHLPIFDSRMAVTKVLRGTDMLNNVTGATRRSLPAVSRCIEHIQSWGLKRTRPSQIDIGQIVAQIEAARTRDTLEPRCFSYYATTHWMFHTRFFDKEDQDCKNSWKLWWRLLCGHVATALPQCPDVNAESLPVLIWAVEHGHGSLFRTFLAESSLRGFEVIKLIRALELHKSIHGQWLGDVFGQYLRTMNNIGMPSTANNIAVLLDLGANPRTPSHTSDVEPLRILTDLICTHHFTAIDEKKLIGVVFAHPTVLRALDDKTLLDILQHLKKSDKYNAIGLILTIYPDLKLEFENIPETSSLEDRMPTPERKATPRAVARVKIFPKTAIEEALDNEMWDEVAALAHYGRINGPTSSGTSLLWKAIETMSDAWVCHLLRLGADPNAGPFTMQQYDISPIFVAECFPLEAALWLRRTRVCIELLRGVNIAQLGESAMRIAQATANWIVMARLRELRDYLGESTIQNGQEKVDWITGGMLRELPATLGAPKNNGRQRRNKREHTALVTACKMLSYPGDGEPRGFPTLTHIGHSRRHTMSELVEIILRLALDEDAEYVNDQDADEKTALHYLTEAFNMPDHTLVNIVNVLISRGADPNLSDCHGHTPLWLAISHSAPIDSMVWPLLEAGADPNRARPLHNFSVLEEAMFAYQGSNENLVKLMRLLINAGADPRNPITFESPDPSLIGSSAIKGMESLVADLEKHGENWRKI